MCCMTLARDLRHVNSLTEIGNTLALRFALLRDTAHNPVMTPEAAEAEAHALYDAVMQRISRSGYTKGQAAKIAGVSVGTLDNLRKNRVPQNSTLLGLTELGFTYEHLARLRTADFVSRYGGTDWSPAIYRLAVKASQLDADGVETLHTVADGLLRKQR